jgi:hypothetical protein
MVQEIKSGKNKIYFDVKIGIQKNYPLNHANSAPKKIVWCQIWDTNAKLPLGNILKKKKKTWFN